MENLRSNEQRSKNAILLIWIVLVIQVLSLISDYFQYELLTNVANGGSITEADASTNDTRQQVIVILYLVAYITSGITFIQWFRRAYFNLHTKVGYLMHSEGWAAGCWFVPFVCLYWPYQIMKELYQETGILLSKKTDNYFYDIKDSLLVWWWTLWIISNIMGQFVFRYSLKAETVDELTTSTIASMISTMIGIPLALLTIKIIKDYASIEPLLYTLKEDQEPTSNNVDLV